MTEVLKRAILKWLEQARAGIAAGSGLQEKLGRATADRERALQLSRVPYDS